MFYGHHHENGDGGRAVLTDAPTDPAVTLADAKKALGIADTSQDLIVGAAIAACSDTLDPAFGGWLGRALRTQSWELQLRGFSRRHHGFCFINPRQAQEVHYIVLPYPPLQSVDSVKYIDVNGIDQTLVKDTDFRVIGQGQPYGKAAIAPLYGQAWPVPRFDDASVRIRFTCGYEESDFIMPKGLKAAIVLGARALMSVSARDMMLFEDKVEGLGSKRYQNNPAAADIVTKAVTSLLFNLKIS